MRLPEAIETSGSFWLASMPDTQSPGSLHITEGGDITLQLQRPHGNPATGQPATDLDLELGWGDIWEQPDRIMGLVDSYGYVTLEQCIRLKGSLTFGVGFSKATFHARLALFGVGYEAGETISFRDVHFETEGLAAWLAIWGIHNEQSLADNTGTITYSLPDRIPVDLPDGSTLHFAFGLEFPSVSVQVTELTVRQTCSINITTASPTDLTSFLQLSHKVCNFMSFSLGQPISITSFTGYFERTSGEVSRPIPVQIFGRIAPLVLNDSTIRPHEPLFYYRDVKERIADIIASWFSAYDSFEHSLNLYFNAESGMVTYLDIRFLWMTQALESFHRANSEDTTLPKPQFVNIVEDILNAVPDQHRGWIEQRLRYANEPSLRARLKKLLEPFNQLFGNKKERALLVSRIVDTRNYLTHYDKSTTNDRVDGTQELYEVYAKLQALFQLLILQHLGFGEESINRMVEENSALREKLQRAET